MRKPAKEQRVLFKDVRMRVVKPDKGTLSDLYESQGLATCKIAERYHVCFGTVANWLESYGIRRRQRGCQIGCGKTIPPPDFATLYDLHQVKHVSAEKIAKRFGTNPTTVRKWLRSYNIAPHARDYGLFLRGQQIPSKEELEDLYIIQQLESGEIRARFNIGKSSLSRWLRKYGISARPSGRSLRKRDVVEPTEEELRHLYTNRQLNIESIGNVYGMSFNSIRRRMQKFGIPVRLGGYTGGQEYICDDGRRVRSSYEVRTANWLISRMVTYKYEPQLPLGSTFHADFLVNGWYIEIWGMKGIPSYDANTEKKLEFYHHHRIPLIELSPHHFSNKPQDKRVLQRKLETCLVPPASAL
jgi:transposase